MNAKKFKIKVLSSCLVLLTLTAQAQLPNFTPAETGPIYESTGAHLASGWFDMDNDDDMDLVITNTSGYNSIYINHPNLLYRNDGSGSFECAHGLS